MGFFKKLLGRAQADPSDPARYVRRLTHKNPATRREAATWLGEHGGAAAVEPLVGTLDDPDVRFFAIEALGKTGDRRAAQELLALIARGDAPVRDAASRALTQLGTVAVDDLLAAMEHRDGDTRIAAARILGQFSEARAVEPLVRALKNALDSWHTDLHTADGAVSFMTVTESDTIVKALGALPYPRAVDALVDVVLTPWVNDTPTKDVLGSALFALHRSGTAQVDRLLHALKAPQWRVRRNAAGALDYLNCRPRDPSLRVLHAVVQERWNDAVAEGPEVAVPALVESLRYVRESKNAGAAALVSIGAAAVEPLVNLLTDDDAWVRREAAWALGQIGDPSAVEPLLKALSLDDWQTRDRAKEALERIGTMPRTDGGPASSSPA